MNDKWFYKNVYAPFEDAWRLVLMIRHLKQDDTDGWKKFEEAQKKYSKLYNCDKGNSFEYFLSRAVLEIADKIAEINN